MSMNPTKLFLILALGLVLLIVGLVLSPWPISVLVLGILICTVAGFLIGVEEEDGSKK